jgi:AcrR family transcriptional regulator
MPPTLPNAALGRPPDMAGDACARRRDKAATKDALLKAAVEVFARLGYDGATTREVAAVAGVNEGLIQRYFGGKAGLLQAIVEGFCAQHRTDCSLAPCSNDLETEIARFLTHELEQTWENRDFMRVLFSRAIVDPPLAQALKRNITEGRIPILVARLKDLQLHGRIDRKLDLEILAETLAFFGFGLGFMRQVVFAEDPAHLKAVVASTAAYIARSAAGK